MTTPAVQPVNPVLLHYRRLHGDAAQVLETSLGSVDLLAAHSRSHSLIADFTTWNTVLTNEPEVQLIAAATRELQFSCLAALTGLYRNAYASLRLTFELALAAVYYSTHDLWLREWQLGKRDTTWTRLKDVNKGVLSLRYADAYFPALRDEVSTYHAIAVKVYRECSEFVHGNAATHEALPLTLSYSGETLQDWQEKVEAIRLVLTFAFILRYGKSLPAGALPVVETSVLATIGHLEEVRLLFGGVPTEP